MAFIKPSDIMRQMAAAPLTKEMLTDLKRELTPEQFERFKRPGITIHESIRMLDEIRSEEKRTKLTPKQKKGSRRK